MTRMTSPDCAVMFNKYIHTHRHTLLYVESAKKKHKKN